MILKRCQTFEVVTARRDIKGIGNAKTRKIQSRNAQDCRFPLEAGLTSKLVFHRFGSLELHDSLPRGLHVL